MKRILFVTILLCGLGVQQAEAQSWKNLLDGLIGGSKKQTKTTETVVQSKFPTSDEIAGKWIYDDAKLAYTGSDMLATLAVAGLQGQIGSYCTKAGLVAGRDAVTFGADNDVKLHIAGREATGTYGYNSLNGMLTITLTVDGKSASFHGTATLADKMLTLLFDANETLQVVKNVSPSAMQNSNVQTLATVIEKYPGLQLGCTMTR